MARKIKEIAKEIEEVWGYVPPSAQPWLDLMFRMNSKDQEVDGHPGAAVILFFLAYTVGVKGKQAIALREELQELVEEHIDA